jgi:hypothetical protein
MTTVELIDDMKRLSKEMETKAAELRRTMLAAADMWPDYQVVKNFGGWHDRNETPPVGQIWASDGLRVWLIHHDGNGIPRTATAVKFWTAALIPAPPINETASEAA